MPTTGTRQAIPTANGLLTWKQTKEQIVEYLSQRQDEIMAALLQEGSGTLSANTINIQADGADKIKLNISNADKVVVSGGQVLTVPSAVTNVSQLIPFENTNLVVYYVGLSYAKIEAEVGLSRKQVPEYKAYEDQIGRVGNADAAPAPVDTPNTKVRLYINGLTEAGETHAGRAARVWLTTPVSADSSVAFVDVTVGYDGTNNYVDLPYSASQGPLGQDVSVNPPSTANTYYKIWVKGPRIARTDFSADKTYAFLGTVTGAGSGVAPSTFDMSNQFAVFLYSLDAAYKGAGSGGGRVMNVTDGSAEIRMHTGDAFDPNLYGMEFKDADGLRVFGIGSWGQLSRCHAIHDDFFYEKDAWSHNGTTGTIPSHLYQVITATGASPNSLLKPAETNPFLGDASGILELVCSGASGGAINVAGPQLHVFEQLPAFRARIAINETSDQTIFIGLARPTGSGPSIGFRIDGNTVKGEISDDTGATTNTASLGTLSADTMAWIYFVVYYDSGAGTHKVAFWFDTMAGPAVVLTSTEDFADAAYAYDTWRLEFGIAAASGFSHATLTMWLDFWEAWTRNSYMGL